MLNYPKKTIEQFTAYINGDVGGLNYIMENREKDLMATFEAIRGDDEAFKYLMDNKKFILAAFANAIWEDKEAFKLLMKFDPDWAAMVNVIEGDERAIHHLLVNKKEHYLNLARSIQSRIHEDANRNTHPFAIFKNLFGKKKKRKR